MPVVAIDGGKMGEEREREPPGVTVAAPPALKGRRWRGRRLPIHWLRFCGELREVSSQAGRGGKGGTPYAVASSAPPQLKFSGDFSSRTSSSSDYRQP